MRLFPLLSFNDLPLGFLQREQNKHFRFNDSNRKQQTTKMERCINLKGGPSGREQREGGGEGKEKLTHEIKYRE